MKFGISYLSQPNCSKIFLWAPFNILSNMEFVYQELEDIGSHQGNFPVFCCGTLVYVVPVLNSEGEGSKTQRCRRSHCDPENTG